MFYTCDCLSTAEDPHVAIVTDKHELGADAHVDTAQEHDGSGQHAPQHQEEQGPGQHHKKCF